MMKIKNFFDSRSSHQRHSAEIDVLKNFANSTENHLCWSVVNKVAKFFSPVTLL